MPNHGQLRISAGQAGVVSMGAEVNHIVGDTATLLSRPARSEFLVLHCESGSFRFRLGDHTADMPADATPTASVADGTGAFPLAEGFSVTLPAPTRVTVKGYTATDVLTYFWV